LNEYDDDDKTRVGRGLDSSMDWIGLDWIEILEKNDGLDWIASKVLYIKIFGVYS